MIKRYAYVWLLMLLVSCGTAAGLGLETAYIDQTAQPQFAISQVDILATEEAHAALLATVESSTLDATQAIMLTEIPIQLPVIEEPTAEPQAVSNLEPSEVSVGLADEPTLAPTPVPSPTVVLPTAAFSCAAVTIISTAECEALAGFYGTTNGPNWYKQTGWLTAENPCDWYGVECVSGHVIALKLVGNRLQGPFPTEVTDLESLITLDLTTNELSGSLPPSLSYLQQLQQLRVTGNHLEGPIPAELGYLSQLQELALADNSLTGSIPAELGNLQNLYYLLLSKNMLEGLIPPELGQASSLTYLALGDNNLSGRLTGALGNLTNLEYLFLHDNHLNSLLPEQLADLPNLQVLNISNNELIGSIPPAYFEILNFEYAGNYLAEPPTPTPPFREWYGCEAVIDVLPHDCEILEDLYVETNGHSWLNNEDWLQTSTVCSWYGVTCTGNNVTGLDLSNNNLVGTIPPTIGNLGALQTLALNVNQLRGPIPAEISHLGALEYLYLSVNQLTGEIPAELGILTNLKALWLGYNQLSGEIPAELGNLPNLFQLFVSDNQLSGTLPENLGNLAGLYEMDFSQNQLSGSLPLTLTNLQNLVTLRYVNTAVCAPVDEGFQTWLSNVVDVVGNGNCE